MGHFTNTEPDLDGDPSDQNGSKPSGSGSEGEPPSDASSDKSSRPAMSITEDAMQTILEKYKDTIAGMSERRRAESEKRLWDAVPYEVRKHWGRREWLSAQLGVSQR